MAIEAKVISEAPVRAVVSAGSSSDHPVTSVNGKKGDVQLNAADVHAMSDEYEAPVTSVNGQTGDVSITSGVAVQDEAPTTGEKVWVDTDSIGTVHSIPEINDSAPSLVDTYSSQKIENLLENKRHWQSVAVAVGGDAITIPAGVEELSIDVQYGSSNLFFSFLLTMVELDSNNKVFTTGYFMNETTSGFCQILATTTSVRCLSLYISGTDYTSSAKTRLFAR